MGAKIRENKDWILVLLWVGGQFKRYNELIIGRTRLMKEVFLLKKQFGIHKNMYVFKASKYGPSSKELLKDLDKLRKISLISVFEQLGGYAYSLTPKGCEIAEELFNALTKDTRNKLKTVKVRYNQMPLSQLLGYVYSRYPEYAIKSEYMPLEDW